ncbi:hypothetical protein K2Y11_21245 [bacterium]|nr:hypothetical protein [bacterium]
MIFNDSRELKPDFIDDRLRQGPLWHHQSYMGWKCLIFYSPESTFLFFAEGWSHRARISAETLSDPYRFRAAILHQAHWYLSDRELHEFYGHDGILQELLRIARRELATVQEEQRDA